MIARGFKSVIWVGAVGGAALCCYMVSLRVATERADLARVDRQIVAAKRDIRSLQTELGTRGRLTQLEDWNSNVLALSAPSTGQFVKDAFTLAQLQTRQHTIGEQSGEVRMAALETGAAAPASGAPPAAAAAAAPTAPSAAPAPVAAPAAPVAHARVVRAIAATRVQPPRADMMRRASFEQEPPVIADAAAARPAHRAAAAVRDTADTEKEAPVTIASAPPRPSRRAHLIAADVADLSDVRPGDIEPAHSSGPAHAPAHRASAHPPAPDPLAATHPAALAHGKSVHPAAAHATVTHGTAAHAATAKADSKARRAARLADSDEVPAKGGRGGAR